MKLEKQAYQVFDRWKIEIVWHKELLWKSKQIIRLKEQFYNDIIEVLELWQKVSLYNKYNPVNKELLEEYDKDYNNNKLASLIKIIDRNNKWPILDWNTLKQVEVIKMKNICLNKILIEDMEKSILFNKYKPISLLNLLEVLSKNFYWWDVNVWDFYLDWKLFFRQIKNI